MKMTMERLFDYVQQNRLSGTITKQRFADAKLALQESIPIVADNVAELFYGPKGDYYTYDNLHLKEHGRRIEPEHFPNLAPPFASYFVEYAPISEERRANTHFTGCHVISIDMKTIDNTVWAEGGEWFVAYDLYYHLQGSYSMSGPYMRHLLLLDTNGEVIQKQIRIFDEHWTERDTDWFRVDCGPAFLTTSLQEH